MNIMSGIYIYIIIILEGKQHLKSTIQKLTNNFF
jgi:hypothetical protein